MVVLASRTLVALLAISLGILVLPVPGCGPRDQDVTNDPAFGDFRSVVGIWRAKVPLRLVERDKMLYLVSHDTPVSGYHELATEPAGTRIRVEHLILRKTIETELLRVTGSLIDGQYAGRPLELDRNFFPWDVMSYYVRHHGDSTATTKPSWTVATDKLE